MPVILTAASTLDEDRAHEEHVRKVESLLFLLVQAKKGAAALVVQRYKRNGHPNPKDTWLELE